MPPPASLIFFFFFFLFLSSAQQQQHHFFLWWRKFICCWELRTLTTDSSSLLSSEAVKQPVVRLRPVVCCDRAAVSGFLLLTTCSVTPTVWSDRDASDLSVGCSVVVAAKKKNAVLEASFWDHAPVPAPVPTLTPVAAEWHSLVPVQPLQFSLWWSGWRRFGLLLLQDASRKWPVEGRDQM